MKYWETEFAGVLEQLESQFYSQALQTFSDEDFLDAGFSSASLPTQIIQYVTESSYNYLISKYHFSRSISQDEASHLTT